jgi:hypothetical protein
VSVDPQRHQRPAPASKDNRLILGVALLGTVFIVSAAGTFVALIYLSRDWGFFVFVMVAFYAMGAVRWMPWRTPLRKAFSTGVFVAVAIVTVILCLELEQERADRHRGAPSFQSKPIE